MEVGASCSIGRVAAKHDMRVSIAKNVSPELSKDNVIIVDNLRGQAIEDYVNDMMQPYIDEYNSKQRRKDRRIETSYCEWHRNNGNLSQGSGQVAYECVIQYGSREDIGKEYYDPKTSPERKAELREEILKVHREWQKELEKNFPHLKTLYYVVHFDEKNGTPHAHWCFTPCAEYDRGLSRQCSIGRALGQDGIERCKDAKEAMDKGGYQLTRFFKKFHHEYQNPTLQRLGYSIKQEIQGRKHDDKSYFADRMADIDQREEEFRTEKQATKQQITKIVADLQVKKQEAEQTKQQLDKREAEIKGKEASANEKMQAADQAVANARQQQADAEKATREAENNEKIAVEKMKQATLQVLDAKRKQEEAAELAKKSYAAKEEVEREIQMKQTRVEELNKKLKNKEDLIQTQDEIDEIFKLTGKGFPYPKILSKGSRGFGKNKISTVEISEKDLEELRGKAASYDTVLMQRKKAEEAAKTALEAADKDQTISEQRDQILALKMELQKNRVERDQAVRKQHDMEFDRNEALDYIARKGLGNDFVDEYNRDQGHHHHIRH